MRALRQLGLTICFSIVLEGSAVYAVEDPHACAPKPQGAGQHDPNACATGLPLSSNRLSESTERQSQNPASESINSPAVKERIHEAQYFAAPGASDNGEQPDGLSERERFEKAAQTKFSSLGYKKIRFHYWNGPISEQNPAFRLEGRIFYINEDVANSLSKNPGDISNIVEVGVHQERAATSDRAAEHSNSTLKPSGPHEQRDIAAALTPTQVETLDKVEDMSAKTNDSYARRAYETFKMLVTGEPTPLMKRFRNVLQKATLTMSAGSDISHQNTWDRLPYHEGPTGGTTLNARLQPGMAIPALDGTRAQKALFTDVDISASYFDGLRTRYIITAGWSENWGEVFFRHYHTRVR